MDKINPVVHLNGTGKDALLREYLEAFSKLGDAIDALRRLTVHGRDYYPLDAASGQPDAYRTARKEHEDHLAALVGVQDRLAEIYQAIDAQGRR